jgi:hypothetical protein
MKTGYEEGRVRCHRTHASGVPFTSVNAVAAGHVIEAPGGREAVTAARCVRALDKGLSKSTAGEAVGWGRRGLGER